MVEKWAGAQECPVQESPALTPALGTREWKEKVKISPQ